MIVISLVMYFVSACLVCIVMALSFRRSAFGVLLATTMIWFLIGACIYPLFDLMGVVGRGTEVSDFISINGEPGLGAAIHILLAAIGMTFGYLYRPRSGVPERMVRWISVKLIGAHDAVVFKYSILLGICSYMVYFSLVGFDLALINAAAARGGDFDGFGEKAAFMFIKTVAAIGLVAACLVPNAIADKNRIFILAYCVLLVMAYANSISRGVILYCFIVPILVYVRLKWDMQKKKRNNKLFLYLIVLAIIPFSLLVMTYGKVMGQFISAYFSGRDYSMTSEVEHANTLDMILNGFGFQWVSVQAGIDHFFRVGFPLITQEQFLAAFFGIIPSRVLDYFGVDFLYYGGAAVKLACVNSSAFGYSECTVPPLAIGYAAYLLPGAGGFLMGFIMLRCYAAIERLWLSIQSRDWRKVWIPYFLFGAAANVFSFIPDALPLVTAQFLWLLALSRFRLKSSSQMLGKAI